MYGLAAVALACLATAAHAYEVATVWIAAAFVIFALGDDV